MHNLTGTERVAYLDTMHSTIRHAECELLVIRSGENGGQRCNRCTAYRSNLRALLSRHVKLAADTSRTDPSSHASFSHLSSSEKCIRYHREHELRRACQRQVANLRMKLQAVIGGRGLSVDSGLHDDLVQIMQDNAEAVCHHQDVTQVQAASLNDARNMGKP